MMSDENNQQSRDNATNISENQIVVTSAKILVLAVFLYPLVYYTLINRHDPKNNGTLIQNLTGDELSAENNENKGKLIQTAIKRKIITQKQPSCPLSDLTIILDNICADLYIKHEQCTPADFHNHEKHKIPLKPAKNNTSTGEPRGTIVGCVAAGLLLTSLGAAFVELYKAKTNQTPLKSKPPMSRKCSLADLTVLKHNRKELVRRESIMEMPEGLGGHSKLGFRPPPLYRRSSFPVGPHENNYGTPYGFYSPIESRRTSVESRRLSIIDSRRSSFDCRKSSIDTRRISVDGNESPERRHWSRLVHRH